MVYSIASIIFCPFISSVIIFPSEMKYSLQITTATIINIAVCILNVILLRKEKYVWKVTYIGMGIIIFTIVFIFFLYSGVSWNFDTNLQSFIFIISPIILDILLTVKRYILKKRSFVVDSVLVAVILFVISLSLKNFTLATISKEDGYFHNIINIIFGTVMVSFGLVSQVYGIYNYFEIKIRK